MPYDQFARQSVLNVKAEQVANFPGHEISPQLAQEAGSPFSTRIEGTRVKHRFGGASVKMHGKFGCVSRIETTTNAVSFFRYHRKVEHRRGPAARSLAPVKKSIYGLINPREILFGRNRRYLEHLSALDDFSAGVRALDRITRPWVVDDKTVEGINAISAYRSTARPRAATSATTPIALAAPLAGKVGSCLAAFGLVALKRSRQTAAGAARVRMIRKIMVWKTRAPCAMVERT